MHRAVLAITVAGCTFAHGTAQTSATDAPAATADDAGSGDAGAIAARCHSSLPDLRLCLDFEQPDLTADRSGLGNVIATTNVAPTTRGGQGAANIAASSTIEIASTPNLTISPAVSIEMWIAPTALPASGEYAYLVSRDDEYSFGLYGARLSCDVASANDDIYAISTVDLPTGTWTHVACVYDGSRVAVYIAGAVAGCWQQALTIGTEPVAMDVAHGYVGGVDDIHVYAGALADADVCALAGGSSCKTGCPNSQ